MRECLGHSWVAHMSFSKLIITTFIESQDQMRPNGDNMVMKTTKYKTIPLVRNVSFKKLAITQFTVRPNCTGRVRLLTPFHPT